jgi:hypothetical protein
MKILNNLDLNLNQLLNALLHQVATDPASSKKSQIWFNTTSNVIKYNNGTAVKTVQTVEELTEILTGYQAKITASGILKGDGNGGVTAATAGTDYQAVINVDAGKLLKQGNTAGAVIAAVAGTDYAYAVLTGVADPTTATAGAVNQFYVNTDESTLWMCTDVNSGEYTWTKMTVDISGKQDNIDLTEGALLKMGNAPGVINEAIAGTDYGYPELSGAGAPTNATAGSVMQHYFDTTNNVEYICVSVSGNVYTWARVTVDISGKQDVIDSEHPLSYTLVSGLATVAHSGSYNDLSDTPDIPEAGTATPNMDGTAAVGSSAKWAHEDHTHPTDTSRQAKITASGILKGDGSGGVTAAVADTDYQSVITVTASKALVSDANGKVSASNVTATELGYLSGVTSPIQDQIDAIPKFNYLDAVECSVADGSSQDTINTAAIAAITAEYSNPVKWNAVVVAVKFTPSDVVKDALYYYNGTAWSFMYYVTTGVQLASGTTAGLIQEATSDSDLTIVGGVATVNKATALRNSRTFNLAGVTTSGAQSFDGTGNVEITITAVPASLLTGQVAIANGGTGKNSIGANKMLIGNAAGTAFEEIGVDTTVTDDSNNLVTSGAVAAAIGGGDVAHKFTAQNGALTPASGTATWTVNHGLNTRALTVTIAEVASPYSVVMADIELTDLNNLTIKINSDSAIVAGTYMVTVIG